ncbi:Ig-like domain-containing protein, partial [Ulvibacter litoralis]
MKVYTPNLLKLNFSKFLSFTVFCLLVTIGANSQTIVPTNGSANCEDCTPNDWNKGAGTPDISNNTTAAVAGTGGGGANWVQSPGSPTVITLPSPDNGHTNWLSLRDLGPAGVEESVSVDILDLTPSREYEVLAYSLTAVTNDGESNVPYSNVYNDYYTFEIDGGPIVQVNNLTINDWQTDKLRFTANDVTETLILRPGANANTTAPLGFDDFDFVESVQISVSVNAINTVPIADDNSTTTIVDTPVIFNVISTDFDPDGNIVANTVDLDTSTSGIQNSINTADGSWSVDSLGNVTFTPLSGFSGEATLPYTVNDDYTLDGFNHAATSAPALLTVNVLPDSDGDGIDDEADLDDDNDGILDSVEIGDCATNNSTLDWDNEYTAGGNSPTAGDDPVATNPNISVNSVGITLSRSTTGSLATQEYRVNVSGGYSVDPYYTLYQSSTTTGQSNHIFEFDRPVYNLSFQLYDVDHEPDTGIFDDSDFIDRIQMIITKEDGSNHILIPSEYTISGQTYTSPNIFIGNSVNANMSIDGIQAWITKIEFVYTNNSGSPANFQSFSLTDFSFCSTKDTDGDGIFDYLDLDSDNDGCPDALEGNGGLNYTNLNPDGSINTTTNPINDNGIPVGPGTPGAGITGQDDVSSTDDQVQSVICQCTPGNPAFVDVDGDLVGDACDLDNDNDGIVDAVECGGPFVLQYNYDESLSDSTKLVYVATYDSATYTITVTESTVAQHFIGPDGLQDVSGVTITAGATPSVQNYDRVDDESAVTFTSSAPIQNIQFTDLDDVDRSNNTDYPTDALCFSILGTWGSITGDLAAYNINTGALEVNSPSANAANNLSVGNSSASEFVARGGLSHVLTRSLADDDETNNGAATFIADEPFTVASLLFEDLAQNGARESILSTFSTSFINATTIFCLDSDGDGIPNNLDLDSDNDGCPDALEGDGGLDYTNLNLDGSINLVTNPVNDNGIPVGPGTAPAGTAGQNDVSSLNASVQSAVCSPCSPGSPTYVDSDGDTIGDACDLDNDNDGLIDRDEMGPCGPSGILSETGWRGILYDAPNQDSWALINGSTTFPSTFAQIATFNYNKFNLTSRAFDAVLSTSPTTLSSHPDIEDFVGTLVPDNGSEDSAIKFSRVIANTETGIYRFDLGYGDDHIVIYHNGTKVYAIQNAYSSTTNDSSPSISNVVTLTLNVGDTLEYVIVEENTGNTAIDLYSEKTFELDGISAPRCILDTDGDTIPNHLDLDSDRDGCYDALEGDGGLDYTNLNPDGSINIVTNPVNDNGIPVGPGTAPAGVAGQNDISSTDALVQSVICNPCTLGHPDYVDTDGDSIGDACDLDDDNDGILDKLECPSVIGAVNSGNNTTSLTGFYESEGNSVLGFTINTEYASSVLTSTSGIQIRWDQEADPTTTIDLILDAPISGRLDSVVLGNGAEGVTVGTQNSFKEIVLTWSGGGSAVLYDPLDEVTGRVTGDILSSGDIIVINNGVSYSLEDTEWSINVDMSNVVTFPTTISFLADSTINGNSAYNREGFAFTPILSCPDIDGDSIPNNLDLDSDGDGCSDADEAYNDLDADDNDTGIYGPDTPTLANGGVDANGLVILAGVTGNVYNTTPATTAGGVKTFEEGMTVTIDTAPSNIIKCETETAQFDAIAIAAPIATNNPVATASTNVTYQWSVSTDGTNYSDLASETGTVASGATVSLVLTGVTEAMSGNTYKVVFTNEANLCGAEAEATLTVNAEDASFNYDAAAYCVDVSDPTPLITGDTGGAFSSAPAGLSLTAATGVIDVSASTPGTYSVTYTTAGTCPTNSSVSITINALDDASFNYDAAAYCVDASDPTPTISGVTGGTFSSAAGLSINASTGAIDVSASTAGTYTVTY